MRTPRAQRSTARPQPVCRTISGALQRAVPASVVHFGLSEGECLASPKSLSLRYPLANRRRFSGFRSRQIMSLECRYYRPTTTHATTNLMSSALPLSPSCLLKSPLLKRLASPPSAYSITRYRQLRSAKAYFSPTINLQAAVANILRSSSRLAITFLLLVNSREMRFIAQTLWRFCFGCFSRTRYTVAKEPWPRRRSGSNQANDTFWGCRSDFQRSFTNQSISKNYYYCYCQS